LTNSLFLRIASHLADVELGAIGVIHEVIMIISGLVAVGWVVTSSKVAGEVELT
jgi:hypothetical protein